MSPTELFADNFTTELSAACSSSDSTIQVASAAPSSLQGSGEFRVLVDGGTANAELMLVTAGASGTTWTVTRGSGTGESPTPVPVAHSSGAAVVQILSSAGLANALVNAEQVAEGVDAAALASETSRAQAAEASKASSSALTAETSRATAAEGANASAISAETTRAQGAESTNASAISSEASRAQAAEATKASSSALTSETSRATAAEGTNATAISTETSRAQAAEAAAITTAEGASAQALVRTSVKTGAYTASPGDSVPVDISGGSVTVTLPTAPADRSRIAVKVINISGSPGSTSATIARGGSDVFNKTGGSASLSLTALFQGVVLQYDHATSVWQVQSTDTPLGAALGAAQLGSDGTVGGPSGSSLTSSVVSRALVAAGNLGSAYAATVTKGEQWVTGTLNANCVVTCSLAPLTSVKLLLVQDATGGRTLSISDGTTTQSVSIATAANTAVVVDVYSPDGTALIVTVP